MSQYKQISIEDFTYNLPHERIARYPLEKRDDSSLLVYRQGTIRKDNFYNIAGKLPADSLVVFNNTRVVQARLLFQKETGARIEVFILEPHGPVKDIQQAFQQKNQSSWFCLVGNAKKWKEGELPLHTSQGMCLKARKGEKLRDGYIIHFSWDNADLSFAEILEDAGKTPLPPYIDRQAEEDDKQRYQTIFARYEGSVAAPTAALHFSDGVMQSLAARNIVPAYLTLHVGAGTFKPVSAKSMGDHHMHKEQIVVHRDAITALRDYCNKNIICVGTTSLRTMESLYWLGVKMQQGYEPGEEGFSIHQWEPYEHVSSQLPSPEEALDTILRHMDSHGLTGLHGETSLIIVPGYRIRMAHVLITNFHQPGSTLLLLVAAFIGNDWRKVYDFALENDFRFLSYGDSCLLFRNQDPH